MSLVNGDCPTYIESGDKDFDDCLLPEGCHNDVIPVQEKKLGHAWETWKVTKCKKLDIY